MERMLQFLGAVGNVTGSSYVVTLGDTKLLIDCGLYQEREFQSRNWEPFPVSPDKVDGVILTHAHLDHCGLLPKLVKEGFQGKIFGTPATLEIARVMLLDSAKIQEYDAEQKKKRHEAENREPKYPERPLYTQEEAREVFPLFSPVEYGREVNSFNKITFSLHDAGHILGSAMVRIESLPDGRTFLFSGDVGRWNRPILKNPTEFKKADYVQVESTYGNKTHESSDQILTSLENIVNSTVRRGGNVVIPSFALGRAQEVMYYLNKLLLDDRIPHLLVFLDSPMAVEITEVFKKHRELYDLEALNLMRDQKSPFDFPTLKLISDRGESKAINHLKGSSIIIASSGMCTGGRIKHHLIQNISRPESTVLFVGYQARGTLGRKILEGHDPVRILGQEREVKAEIARLGGLSAHADREELLKWLTALENTPREVFVTHGEDRAVEEFAQLIREQTGWEVTTPGYGDTVHLR